MKKQTAQDKFTFETHELKGRDVTIVVVKRGAKLLGRGVSIRNPKDCPIESDGIKFALARAMKQGRLSKVRRRSLWNTFRVKFQPTQQK